MSSVNEHSQQVWDALRTENARLLEEVTRLQKQLHENEVRLRLVSRAISSVVIDWDIVTNEYHRVNSLEALMGFGDDEVKPTTDWTRDRIHPDDKQLYDSALQEWINSDEEELTLDMRCMHKDGAYRSLRGQAVMLRDPATRKPLRIVASYRDISSELEAAYALQQSDERYRMATEAMQGIIFDWNIATGLVHRSSGVQRAFGYTQEEEIKNVDWWKSNVHPDDRDGVVRILNVFIEAGAPRGEIFYRFRHRQGHYLHIHSTFLGLRNEQGRAVRIVGSMQDITPRLQAEEEKQRAIRHYQQLFEDIPLGMMVLDPRLRILECNQALADLLHYRQDELIGRHVLRIAVPDEWQEIPQPGQPAEHGFEFVSMKHIVRRDGARIPIQLRGKFIRYPQYDQPCRFGIIENLTEHQRAEKEKKRLEQHLQETQRLESLGVLAGGVAHDFNNLLTVILGNISLLKQEKNLNPGQVQGLTQCEEASKQAAELCRQMLAYAGRGKLENKPFQLSELVETSKALLQSAATRHHHLHLHLSQGLPCVVGDPSQVRQILLNLVQNAAESIEQPGGTIDVLTGVSHLTTEEMQQCLFYNEHVSGDYVWLEVRDTGSGMDEVTSKRIFEPFFTTKFTGRGLGLAAVAGIVRNHKGLLLLQRSQPGQGTCFRVYFHPDLSHSTVIATSASPAVSTQHQQGTILVVDDEPTVRMVLAKLLARRGYAVIEAENGNEALELAERYRGNLRLIILDLTMPHRDGASTLEELRKRQDRTPVLVISGYYSSELLPQLDAMQARFLNKPFTAQSLLEAAGPFLNLGATTGA
ncbi:MAG: PAS domain S-box protein [Gemmatales bacterium]